ncbi:beta-phosphoglucomutase family hydrolase [Roseomonas sp. OT10]|uniref:HAD family hydrolase n=1 Tax=Roseomonas cutis TaxID=2897332 RepID=UPI001E4B4C64|nr:beta-phosphoglucomutase family hydrolase [Roseomonas sp. OT10]UFN47984.1 beta-phosphoglucomutase family hydrolase [Roseomonas sp. OT10]
MPMDATPRRALPLAPGELRAWLFDLDGVVTQTGALHAEAWKRLFDPVLERMQGPGDHSPFRLPEDYTAHVDGRPRLEGIRTFLAARGLDLPEGGPEDPAGAPTVQGLARRKDALFHEALSEQGVVVFPGSLRLMHALRGAGARLACVSASRNARPVLERAGLTGMFDVILGGEELAQQGLAGKPAPDSFLAAARALGTPPERCVVIEDALAGVEAGRAGGFGLVIGVDRGAGHAALREAGADLVVDDLGGAAAGADAVTAGLAKPSLRQSAAAGHTGREQRG